MNQKNLKISLCLNTLITLMTLFATITMFIGFRYMHSYDIVLDVKGLGVLKFFTVQSNIFMGLIAFIFSIKEIEVIRGKNKDISLIYYILKLIGTVSVGLTFFIVFTYLGPISKDGIPSMLMNSNLFFHLLIPVISILNFTLFEKTNKLRFKHTFYGTILTLIYGMYYLINILIHTENGKVSTIYDWYWFVQNGVWTALFVIPLIFLITYLISLVLWRLNKLK